MEDPPERLLNAPMMVRSVDIGGFVRASEAFCAQVGCTEAEFAAAPLLDWIAPEDHPTVRRALAAGRGRCVVGLRTRDGIARIQLELADEGAGPVAMGHIVDEEDDPGVDFEPGDGTVLGTLATIANIVENQNPGYRCSILLVTDGRFVSGAGPSLPDEYNQAIDGYAIGPFVGSCGTAIYWNVPVIVTDIQADPLWAPFAELARTAGVAACWSHPFTSRGGRVLGALALYSPEPSEPTAEQLSRLRAAAQMTGLAVERGRAEEALREQRKRELELEDQLRQAAKMEALGVLAGGVAHDFNNVLAGILANAELALEITPDSGDMGEMLQEIVDASKHAAGFCQQMLAYAGRGEVQATLVEVGALLPQLSTLVQAAVSKKVELEYRLLDSATYVQGDESQLLQVLMNLITNAAEAIGEAPGRIVVSSELVTLNAGELEQLSPDAGLPPGEFIQLAVSDTGCGLDAETQERMFDPFFTTKFTGRGLGLAAVRGIVDKHQGAVRLDSVVGIGTTFTVYLPTTAGGQGRGQGADADSDLSHLVSKRILVVDDDARLRAALCRRLRHTGFDVVEAADGQEALDRFGEDPDSIDLVLLDLSMPRLSGEEVHKSLIAVRPQVPVVLMSGFTEREVLDRFVGARLAGVLQKPIEAATLLEAVRAAISPDSRTAPQP